MSEYSRIKYGHQGTEPPLPSYASYPFKGCPILYAPLSLHLPDVVRGLRERQEKYADQVLWWPCASSVTPADRECGPLIPAAKQRAALATGETVPHPELQTELSNALSESITIQSNQADTSNSALHIKTSETHPIKSVDSRRKLLVTDQLLQYFTNNTSGVTRRNFVSSHSILDRIAGYPQLSPSHVELPLPSISQHKYLPSNDIRSSLAGAVNAALNTKISLPPLPVPSSRILLSFKRNLKSHTISDGESENDVTDANPKLPPRHSPFSSTQTAAVSQTSQSRRPSILALPTTYALHPFIRPPTAPSPPNKISKFRASKSSTTTSPPHGTASQRPFKLGNLLLSSCPGKKVRLSGPVRGRSAVCRSLDVDLRRMKMLGARCVVCCLDNEELEFLIGASWFEYCQVAHREGLDVLRIPLPEGLTPLSPKSLDADLDRIIEKYTLRGISVLVHCRGGVGRAGLFACCWMLKLGLCGWIED
ncbi:hypothetical protein J3R82DRAFT_10492 [Butyriboletus roseoflavus]|nr:hypothetical protein J3R82DRAFT_10492 [Butyriboletus roseoflavus]